MKENKWNISQIRPDTYYRLRDIHELTGITYQTVYYWIRRGLIQRSDRPHHFLGADILRVARLRTTELNKPERKRALATNNTRRHRERNKVKYAARRIVSIAIRSGQLTPKPCLECGLTPTEAHHEDYTKPLDVIWLCRGCHIRKHNH